VDENNDGGIVANGLFEELTDAHAGGIERATIDHGDGDDAIARIED